MRMKKGNDNENCIDQGDAIEKQTLYEPLDLRTSDPFPIEDMSLLDNINTLAALREEGAAALPLSRKISLIERKGLNKLEIKNEFLKNEFTEVCNEPSSPSLFYPVGERSHFELRKMLRLNNRRINDKNISIPISSTSHSLLFVTAMPFLAIGVIGASRFIYKDFVKPLFGLFSASKNDESISN